MSAGDWEPLLERARRRDPQALGALLERFAPRLYGLVYRLTGDRGAAEDLLQETFLRIVRMIGEYDHSGRFEPWIFRIAANVARDHTRRRRRRAPQTSLDGECEGLPEAPEAEPTRGLEIAGGIDQLGAALQALPDGDREILLMRHFADYTYREIAEMQEVPLGTALARGHRALERLRRIMGEESA